MSNKDIETLRAQIDDIDLGLLDLLNRRMSLSAEIGRLKNSQGKDVLDSDREEQVIHRLVASNSGPLPETTLKAIYREVFSGSRLLQAPITVAFLGPAGTYTHEASLERFGHSASYLPCGSVSEVFDEVNQGGATFGVVPIENSIEGSVRETLDLLMTSRAGACGEISIRISHALMNLTGKMEDVRVVMSHPQALAQCRQWLMHKLTGIPVQESSSTARAAQRAMEDTSVAAIANERLGAELGLQVLRRGVQDRTENITRFLVLGRVKPRPTGRDRTAIVFWTEDRPGALFQILEKFAHHKINLSRIESRPDKGDMPWKYAFFVDLEGHRDAPNISNCLDEIATRQTLVKIIGSFPVHTLPAGD
jgi:chorismate mutase / prephenate dehydratase